MTLYECEHTFVIPEGDEFLCKDCNETFAQHPADLVNPIPEVQDDPVEEPEYLLASGMVGQQATYTFPNISQPFPTQTILASGISNSSFANFAKPLMRAVFPQVIADEIFKVTK